MKKKVTTKANADLKWKPISWKVLLVLAAVVFALYYRVSNYEFIEYDDVHFIVENKVIQHGFTWDAVKWALQAELFFKTLHLDYWQPVTVLSRILDIKLFGFYTTKNSTFRKPLARKDF